MNTNISQAVGRRKEAVARVRLTQGPGQITVNGKPIADVFPGPINQKLYQKPFELTQTQGKYTGSIKVQGGGYASQLQAIVHGLARALQLANKDLFRSPLKKAGLLTRDARVRERRKIGQGGRARAKKQSPKR